MQNRDGKVLDKVIKYLQNCETKNVQMMYNPESGDHHNMSKDLLNKIDRWIKEVNIYE